MRFVSPGDLRVYIVPSVRMSAMRTIIIIMIMFRGATDLVSCRIW